MTEMGTGIPAVLLRLEASRATSVNTTGVYFKTLDYDGAPFHGGLGKWALPKGETPGEWMPRIFDLKPCWRGYHLSPNTWELLAWLGPVIYEAEVAGQVVTYEGKVVAETARLLRKLPWDDRTARLFAADCAEHVLPIFERERPGDERPWYAIQTVRRYANGEVGRDVMLDAGVHADSAASGLTGPARVAATTAAATCTPWATARIARGAVIAPTSGGTSQAGTNVDSDALWFAERDWQATRLDYYLHSEGENR